MMGKYSLIIKYYLLQILASLKHLKYRIYRNTYPLLKIEGNCKNNLYILPHEGIGDIVSLIPGLNFLSKKFNMIYIIWDKEKWCQLKIILDINSNIECIQYYHNRNYNNVPLLSVKGDKHHQYIKLGHYGNVPVYEYPTSFYFQLSLPKSLSEQPIILKTINSENFSLPDQYVYINFRNSNGNLNMPIIDGPKVISTDNNTLLIDNGEQQFLYNLNSENSLALNISIALKAKQVWCSDAAIFNILIRLNECPDLFVHTRIHSHFHNTKIYKNITFNGTIQNFCN